MRYIIVIFFFVKQLIFMFSAMLTKFFINFFFTNQSFVNIFQTQKKKTAIDAEITFPFIFFFILFNKIQFDQRINAVRNRTFTCLEDFEYFLKSKTNPTNIEHKQSVKPRRK